MANEVQAPPGPGIASLATGVVNDISELIKQEFRFAQAEIKTDLRKTAEASLVLGLGLGAVFLSLFTLTLMLVHLLHWLTLPAGADPAGLPLWACHGLVGVLILATGVCLIQVGKKKFSSFNPLPDQTAESIRENVGWITNSK